MSVRQSPVHSEGYAPDLNEAEQLEVGCDPFLISYAYANPADRCVVTFEVSSPAKSRGRRKIPDVCLGLNLRCQNLFKLIEDLDFTTDWTP